MPKGQSKCIQGQVSSVYLSSFILISDKSVLFFCYDIIITITITQRHLVRETAHICIPREATRTQLCFYFLCISSYDCDVVIYVIRPKKYIILLLLLLLLHHLLLLPQVLC